MSIFVKVRQFGELKKLRKAARVDPTPETLGALAERYISQGRIEDAARVAERGIERFPASERLKTVRTFTRKQQLQTQISTLRAEMAKHPSPLVFSQLAEINLELGNHEQALRICEQCIERFPLNEAPYLIIGQIRLERFCQDRIAHDGLEAETQLRRVSKLNSQNVKSHLLLSLLYYLIGALGPMKKHLETALNLAPDSRQFDEFVLHVEAGTFRSGPMECEEEDNPDDPDDYSVAEMIRSVEVNSAFRNRLDLFPESPYIRSLGNGPKARLDLTNLRQNLAEIGTTAGVLNAVILDRDSEPLADCCEAESLTRSEFSELVSMIMQTSQDASRRMDVGTLQWCTVEGTFGGITVTKVKDISLGLKYEHVLKPERAHQLLEEFASKNFRASTEVPHA